MPPPVVYNWTGFYLGGNVGVSAGYDPLTQTSAFPPGPISVINQSSHDPFGAIGGVQAGYNWQSGSMVLGVEGDFQFSGQTSDPTCLTFCDFNFQNPSNIQFDSVKQSIGWFATLRGRVGYAAGPALFYLTAGAAVADIKTDYSTSQFARFAGTASDTKTGLAVGGGIEGALYGNWTAKIEYLYLDYGSISDSFSYTAGGGAPVVSVVAGSVHDHTARLGLNYRFGEPVPKVAPVMLTKAPVMPATYNWSGFYLGGNVGYSVGRDPTSQDTFGLFGEGHNKFTLVPHGWLGGVQAGYNWQLDHWVLGLEGDYQFADQNDTACFNWCFASNTTYNQSLRWFATGRARVGVAAGPALFYVTGGAAWTAIRTSASIVNTFTGATAGSFTNSMSGWVVGGGVEGALAAHWTAKVEYLYMDFGSFTNLFPGAPALSNLADPNVHATSSVRDSIFRVGLDYHFGGPVVASY